jgi:hypothetical protein
LLYIIFLFFMAYGPADGGLLLLLLPLPLSVGGLLLLLLSGGVGLLSPVVGGELLGQVALASGIFVLIVMRETKRISSVTTKA